MQITLCKEGTVAGLAANLEHVTSNPAIKSLMILACDANEFTPEQVDPLLKQCRVPVFGGIFPQIIAGDKNLSTGTLVIGMEHAVHNVIIAGLNDPEADLDDSVATAFSGIDCHNKTCFVFVDGLSKRIASLVEGLFNNLGLLPRYIGGGAGSLSFVAKPCLFTNDGLIGAAAVVAVSDVAAGIGVAHGWQPVTTSIKVTEAQGNRVISLNWEPALEIYKQAVKQHSNPDFDATAFFDIAKAYPLGITKLDTEMIVRDPIIAEGNHLICVGEVPEGSYIYILNGNLKSLVKGAESARDAAWKGMDSSDTNKTIFFIDCISRVLFMENEFHQELSVVSQGRPMVGALTLGEIANTGDDYLEFYNKTAVVGVLNESS